jgi:glutaredoxin
MIKKRILLVLLSFVIGGLFSVPAAAVSKAKEPQGEPKRAYGAIDVILYQTSWCRYCAQAREYLQNSGVSLVIYDIERDSDKLQEMTAKSGSRGVPVIDVEGIIIRGYSVKAMSDAIERKRRE